jgi:small-conductance mechanosensitive channel
MVAGIMILYTKEFRIGDIVEINADQVYFGRIEEIAIRYTIIRTLDLRQVVIPNTTLITCPIKTFSSEPIIKLTVIATAHCDSDTSKVIEVMKAAVNSFDIVKDKDNTKVFLSNFLDSSIEFKAIFSFDPNCGVLQEIAIGNISQKIGDEFTKNNIIVPYNILTLNFQQAQDQKKIADQIPA